MDAEKAFDRFQHLFMIKSSQQIRNKRKFSQLDKEFLQGT